MCFKHYYVLIHSLWICEGLNRAYYYIIIIMFTTLCLWDHFEKQALFMIFLCWLQCVCVSVCGYGSAVPVWTADEGSELLTRPRGGGPEASAESQSPSTPAILTNGPANSHTHNTGIHFHTRMPFTVHVLYLNAYACRWNKSNYHNTLYKITFYNYLNVVIWFHECMCKNSNY